MKKINRFFALMLVVLLMTSLALPAAADDGAPTPTATTYTITINKSDANRAYDAHQIFTGDISTQELSNVEWGDGITEAGKAALIARFAAGVENASADDVAQAILTEADAMDAAEILGAAGNLQNPGRFAYTNGHYELAGLEPGYYMIVDNSELSGEAAASLSAYMMRLVKNVTVTPKDSVPTLEKKVSDINDSLQSDHDTHLESADYDIGDTVPFHIHITLGNNIEQYEEYEIVITDTLSKGLTYQGNLVVKYGTHALDSSCYRVTDPVANANGTSTFTIVFDDLYQMKDSSGTAVTPHAGGNLIINYEATLNEDAVVGSAGNINTASMTFSNNPNGEGTGKTPEDTAIVFTYQLNVNKVDQDGDPLAGAEFTLYKNDINGEWIPVSRYTTNSESTSFSFAGLDDGEYKLVESKTPAGYNTIEDMLFNITAEHGTTLVSLNGEPISGTIELDASAETGILSTTVVNEKGATLPSTGGIGTTIFYMAGGLLVCVAIVVLVTKKRMAIEE